MRELAEAVQDLALLKRTQTRATAKADRRALWPSEVRDRGPKVFSSVIQLTHDNHHYRVEIRSRKGGSFYAMTKGRVAKGPNRQEAILRLVELIDAEALI